MAKRKQKHTPRKRLNPVIVRIMLVLLTLLLIYFLFISGSRGSWQLYKSNSAKENLQQEIQALELRKAKLDSERTKLLNDPAYIEKVAREKYNMKKKGEQVFRIEDTDKK